MNLLQRKHEEGDIFQPKGFQNQILKVEKQWPLLIAPKQTHKNKQTKYFELYSLKCHAHSRSLNQK